MNAKHKMHGVPSIVEDTIRERASNAYRASKEKRLLTDSNGKICRLLEMHFPDDLRVELPTIERIFAEAWFEQRESRT